jgi:hypothetical protein
MHWQVLSSCWAAGLRAELLPRVSPSMTEQYDFAAARHIRWLVVLDASKMEGPQGPLVKVCGNGRLSAAQQAQGRAPCSRSRPT